MRPAPPPIAPTVIHLAAAMTLACLWILSVTVAAGCDSGESRVQITSPFFFDSSGEFHQSDLGGQWSGTLAFGNSAYTVTFVLNNGGFVESGLESDLDAITDGFLALTDTHFGDIEFEYLTDTGVRVTASGFVEVGNDRVSALFTSSEGFSGDLHLAKVPGLGTFTTPFIQGVYDIEFADSNYDVQRSGLVDVIFSGFLRIGTPIGTSEILNGQIIILDGLTGRYQGTMILVSGEVIFVTGLISLADRVLGGISTNELGVEEIVTFFPR